MAQGSKVTYKSQPLNLSFPKALQASRITNTSAWAEGSLSSRVLFPDLAKT